MNSLDWFVLLATMIGIAAYGVWRTRDVHSLNTYLKGNRNTGWGTIGSVGDGHPGEHDHLSFVAGPGL